MPRFAENPKATHQAKSPKVTPADQSQQVGAEDVNPVLHLQRTIGNQAMQRFLQTSAEDGKTGSTSSHLGHDVSRTLLHPPTQVATKGKLSINTPGDEYEQQADRVAERVMRMPEPRLQRAGPLSGASRVSQKAQPSPPPESLQTKRVQTIDSGHATAPPIVNDVLNTSGRPLDAATRTFMEPRFGQDFSQVRVHTDDRAAESSRSVDAAAYTVGKHVVFGAGQYQPDTHGGKALLAHELAHVNQQSISGPLLQRAPIPGWNFTPSDFSKLQGAGKDLTIAADSTWFPSKLQQNLLNTLRFVLGPKISPPATEGVNVLDFFHGHLVVDRKDLLLDWEGNERPPEQATKHADDFESQEKSAAAKTLGGKITKTKFGPHLSFRKYPLTAKNLPAFTAAVEKLLPAFGNVLEEGSKVPGAAVMYHTFEFVNPSDLTAKGETIKNESPRRQYVTPLNTNAPRQYTPPTGATYEKEYLVIAPFSFLVDTTGAVHVRPFAAGGGSLFTSLELSTVTGKPFPEEPFPIPSRK